MPSVQIVEHEVCSFGIFSILTMQTRQEPSIADAGVVAVVGNRDAVLDGGLQDGLALLDGDLPAVDRQRHGFHNGSIISVRLEVRVQGRGSRLNGSGAHVSRLTIDASGHVVLLMSAARSAPASGTLGRRCAR